MRPIIGITADLADDKLLVAPPYTRAVIDAGGVPIILPPPPTDRLEVAAAYLALCHGVLLVGGDDPIMEHWGVPTHPKAKPIDPARQAFELALLDLLASQPEKPVLGVCLGMQLMGLHAGGELDQFLPDHLPSAADHWDGRPHEVSGEIGRGVVTGRHRQALTSPGRLHVVARARDGVIEAVSAPERPFYLGVQWHPERTEYPPLGAGLVRRFVAAAAA
jgi:putative glutamine amidotransferase